MNIKIPMQLLKDRFELTIFIHTHTQIEMRFSGQCHGNNSVFTKEVRGEKCPVYIADMLRTGE